jgi:hypothetical protein
VPTLTGGEDDDVHALLRLHHDQGVQPAGREAIPAARPDQRERADQPPTRETPHGWLLSNDE